MDRSRSSMMAQLMRIARLAERSRRTGESADEVLGVDASHDALRRRLLQGAAVGGAAIAAGTAAARMLPGPLAQALQFVRRTSLQSTASLQPVRSVAVVGAGLAGLVCATELARLGIPARVFEAATRVGGRCWTQRGLFPGQVAERGAEFISTSHHVVLGYARALELPLEASADAALGGAYFFGGRQYSEAQVLDEYRAFADCIREDVATLGSPTADSHTEQASTFDFMSLEDYLLLYGAGPLLRGVIGAACAAEFGVEPAELSAVAFLRLAYGDRRTKLAPHGAQRAAQLHVVGGTDLLTTGLATRLGRPIELGTRLVAVRRMATGAIRLTFDVDGRYVQSDHDALVLALPPSVLADVDFHPSVEVPAWKRAAIAASTMGAASKLMLGFRRPFWTSGSNRSGDAQADLPSIQNVWESNPSRRAADRAVLTVQVGGRAAHALRAETLRNDSENTLSALHAVLPGSIRAARRHTDGAPVAAVQNWAREPHVRGAFVYPRPGYFTTIAHNEAKPVGNVLFAGDHTSSFYEWQGSLEGAALSGLRAAAEARALLGG